MACLGSPAQGHGNLNELGPGARSKHTLTLNGIRNAPSRQRLSTTFTWALLFDLLKEVSIMTATLFVRRFTDTDRIVQAFAAFPSALLVVTERSVQRWQEREGELVRFEDTHLAAPVLLALTHLQQNNLTLLVIAGSNSHSGLRTYNLVWVGSSSQSLSQIPVTVPHLLNGGGVVKRETMPQASQAVLTGASSDCLLCSASLYQGWVHVMAMTPHPNPVSCNEVVTALHSFCEEAADQFQGGKLSFGHLADAKVTVHTALTWGLMQVTVECKAWHSSQQLCIKRPSS